MGTRVSRVSRPERRWRGYAAKTAVTVALAAGAAAGCSSQPAATQGSVTACFQFASAAIQRHITVTAVPPACQGLSHLQVNVVVGRALHAAAAGVPGKSQQREVIARDSQYVDGLIQAVPAASQPAAAPTPPSAPPSRTALSLAALSVWLVTIGLGLSMMARWILRRGTGPRSGRGPVLNFAHLGLALTSLLVWILFLITGVTGLAYAACGLLLVVVSLGMTLVFLELASPTPESPPENDPPSRVRPPVPVVAAHITAAVVTLLLATLAAAGAG